MKQAEPAGPVKTLIDVATYLKESHGIIALGSLGFENTYVIALPTSKAERLGLRTIHDLVPHAACMKLGGDYEFFGRPEWHDLRSIYGLSVAEQIGMDAGLMYEAASRGTVDAIVAFSTDGRVDAFSLAVLQDTQQALPPYDAIVLLSPWAAQRRELVRVLRPLINTISTENMRWTNRLVDVDQKSPR